MHLGANLLIILLAQVQLSACIAAQVAAERCDNEALLREQGHFGLVSLGTAIAYGAQHHSRTLTATDGLGADTGTAANQLLQALEVGRGSDDGEVNKQQRELLQALPGMYNLIRGLHIARVYAS